MPQTASMFIKRQGLLESIATLIYHNKMSEFVIVQLHYGVIKAGVGLGALVSQLDGLGSAEDRARKDKKRSMLCSTLAAVGKFVASVDALIAHRRQVQIPDPQPQPSEPHQPHQPQPATTQQQRPSELNAIVLFDGEEEVQSHTQIETPAEDCVACLFACLPGLAGLA